MHKFFQSNLAKRAASVAVLAPAFILAVYLGGIFFYVVVTAALALAFNEWMNMALKSLTLRRDMIIGSTYLSVAFIAFIFIRMGMPGGGVLTFALLGTIWACDIGAYFTGKKIGGPKMAPTLSPNKTISGLMGGMVCSAIVMMLFDLQFSLFGNIWLAGVLGVLLAGVGQVGDVMISYQKRRVGVKDTGNLIPGHGGILDRIDSLMLAAPVFLICLWMIHGW